IKEKDENAAKTGEHANKESTSYSYSCPENPNVNFTILPSIERATFPSFKAYIECVEIEKYNAFFILTAEKFSKRHLIFAKNLQSKKKPFFFIRTKIDKENHPEKREKEINEEKLVEVIKTILVENLKEFDFEKKEIYFISNYHPDKWDFDNLTEAITDALPDPQKKCFSTMLENIQKLIDTENFENFLKESKARDKDVKKFFPSKNEIKQLFVGTGIVGVQRMMHANLNGWENVTINLAILGDSGVGKSSFINAIRG
ncbi:interferon-inducible GTPase 5-like, partial [Paramuricea clavata]